MQALSSMLGNLTKKTQEAQRIGSQPPVQVQTQWSQQPVPVHQGSQALLQILQQAGSGTSVPSPAQTQQQSPSSTAIPYPPPPTEPSSTDVPSALSSAPVFSESKGGLNIAVDDRHSTSDPIGVTKPLEGEEERAMDAGQPEAKNLQV